MRAKYLRSVVWCVVLVSTPTLVRAEPPEPKRQLVLQATPAVSVSSVAVSSDGRFVATAAGEGGLRLYDARDGTLLRVFGEQGDRSVAFSPDGRTLLAAGFHMDKRMELFDVLSGRIVRTFDGHNQIETYAAAISPDGKLVASACRDHEILVWEAATGKLQCRIDEAPAVALAFSPDSATLATGGFDRKVRLWNAKTGKQSRVFDGHGDCVVTLAFSPDGATIASGSCDFGYHRGRNTVYFAGRDPGCRSEWKLWDVASGELRHSVAEDGRLLSLAISPNGQGLACGIGKAVWLYDLARDFPGRVLTTHVFDVTSVAFTPDSLAVISASHDQTVRRVAVKTGKLAWQTPGSVEQVNSVALSADGSLLATGSSDYRFAVRVLKSDSEGIGPGSVRLWNARSGRLLHRLGDRAEQIMSVALSPEGTRLAAGGANAVGSGVVRGWDTSNAAELWVQRDHAAEVLAIAYAPDGSLLATGSADGLIRLRDPLTGVARQTLEGHERGATSIAFSPDSELLVCGDGSGGTRVWNSRNGRLLRTCRYESTQAASVTTDRLFTSVAMSPDGATFAVCPATVGNTFGEPVRLWETQTGALKPDFSDSRVNGRPIALSPDGTILATGGKTVKLWDIRTGKLLRELVGHLKKTQSLAFSADGRLLIAGGSYGTTNVWDVASGAHRLTLFTLPGSQPDKNEDDWLAYSPDGFYDGSSGVERYLAWRVGEELEIADDKAKREFHRPERIEAALTVPPGGAAQ